jgi:hypothetical protein
VVAGWPPTNGGGRVPPLVARWPWDLGSDPLCFTRIGIQELRPHLHFRSGWPSC